MTRMNSVFRKCGVLILTVCTAAGLLSGCGDKNIETGNMAYPGGSSAPLEMSLAAVGTQPSVSDRDSSPVVYVPVAGGTLVHERNNTSLDCSNMADGYVILTYHGSNEKVKFQIRTPDETKYTYLVSSYGEPVVFPLTGGDGSYTFSVLESVDLSQDLYAISFSQDETVAIADEFRPFLNPNIYSDFTPDSVCVAEGEKIATGCETDLDVIEGIYNYVTKHISYDTKKAQSVEYGYIPQPDETLTSKTGICFDYAALMTAMLRSQRIPTRLEVGYAGEVYHAWISCYVYEIGWVDNIIQFDGEHWSLMDPTLAANNSSYAVQEYIGDGSRYVVKYTY